MEITRRFATFLAATGVVALVTGPAVGQSEDDRFVAFGSSSSGSSQYVYGGMLAGMARKHLPEISITNQATSSSTQNLDLLRRGEIQMAVVSPEKLFKAKTGVGDYEGNAIPVGILWVMNDQATLMFTQEDSDIESFRDLKGKRVAIGPVGSSNEVKNSFILEAYGYQRADGTKSDFTDLTTVKLSHSEAANALAEGAIDAAIATQPVPAPPFAELAYSVPLKYIGVDKDLFDEVAELYPWMWSTTVAADRYEGQSGPIETLGDRNYIVAHQKNLSTDNAYKLTKTYVENLLPEMAKQVNYLKSYEEDNSLLATPWAIEGHPGSTKYFEEIGVEPNVVAR